MINCGKGRYLAQITVFTGIDYSSPTLASAIGNLSPAFTFLLAVIFRSLSLSLDKFIYLLLRGRILEN